MLAVQAKVDQEEEDGEVGVRAKTITSGVDREMRQAPSEGEEESKKSSSSSPPV